MNLNRPRSSTLNRFANVRSYSSLSNYQHQLQLDNEVANINSNSYSNFQHQQQQDRVNNLFSSSSNPMNYNGYRSNSSNGHYHQNNNNNINNSNYSNQQNLPVSSLSSTQQYNNYSNVNNNNPRPLTATSFGNYATHNLYSYSNNSNNNNNNGNNTQGVAVQNNDNVQYGPNLGRRKSISNCHGGGVGGLNIRRSQTPQPSSQTPSVIYQPATFQLFPPQPQPTMSITNIPAHSKAMEMLVKPLPLSITPVVENVVVRVPTARRKKEKKAKNSSNNNSPKSNENGSTSSMDPPIVGNGIRQTYQSSSFPTNYNTNTSSMNNNNSIAQQNNTPMSQNSHPRPSSSSSVRKTMSGERPLKTYSSSGNLLMNRPRSSTPTMKKSTSLNKIPPRDHLHRTFTKSPSTPSLLGNSANSKSSSSGKKKTPQLGNVSAPNSPQKSATHNNNKQKQEIPSPSNKVPKLLKSIVELKAQQQKIEIFALEDYMLDSPSRTLNKVYEEIPPPKHKLLAILMDINIRYSTHVTSSSHPNYEFYSNDREVNTTLKERQAFLVETRYGKTLSPVDDCGIQFEGAYFGRYSFVFNIDTNYFGYHSWTLILRVYLDSESTTLCVFGEKYCWFTVDINNVKMNNQEFQRTIGGMKLNDWNEIYISLNMLQQLPPPTTASASTAITGNTTSSSLPSSPSNGGKSGAVSSGGRQILVWANGINTVIPLDSETKLKVKPGENKSLNFLNMLNGRAFRGSVSSIVLLNKASESMEDLIRSGKSFLKNHRKPTEKPNLIKMTQSPQNSPQNQRFKNSGVNFEELTPKDEEEDQLVFA